MKKQRHHFPNKGRIVKAMVFPVVMYGCERWTIKKAAAAAAKLLQSCPTLCDPTDGSPPGSAIPGILQARTLEWVAISFSNVWKWSHSVMSYSSRPHGLQPARLLHPWDFPGKSTGVGCHCLLRRIGLVVLYSFSFCFPEKLFIFPSILNCNLAG